MEQEETQRTLLDGQDITHRPAGQRRFGMVVQNYALFRHMNVADNIAFSLRVLPRRTAAPGSRSFWR